MWVEGIVDGEEGGERFGVERGRSSSKKAARRTKKGASCAVQRLYDACLEGFSGGSGGAGDVPSAEDVELLKSVLDDMKPEDVGLSQTFPYFRKAECKGPLPITYLHLYECDRFSIGIFCLPQYAIIPLHNHPGMTVFSKLLFGSMHIRSYDWLDASPISLETGNLSPNLRLAKLQTDVTFTAPCDTSILYPTSGGNMHCFTAITSCAVIDVLGPPYSDSEGRHCTYYMASPYGSVSGNFGSAAAVPPPMEGYAWLQEREKPDDFFVIGAKYKGPKIVER